MQGPLYIEVSQTLYTMVGSSTHFKDWVNVACKAGRLDLIKFNVNPNEVTFGSGVFEVDNAGRTTLVNAWWDDSD